MWYSFELYVYHQLISTTLNVVFFLAACLPSADQYYTLYVVYILAACLPSADQCLVIVFSSHHVLGPAHWGPEK